ncbi:MAG: PAS domain-containing protein [Woeseiaceae bacterium]|nr:PAS domain-containing protein [Woeseiaceae bacterium]
MKLRHLAIVLAVGAVAGLLGLSIYAAWAWSELDDMLDEERRISGVHARAVRMSNAVDYITLLRLDAQVLAAVKEDAESLQAELAPIDDAAAREAARHLGEMAHMAGTLQIGDAPADAGRVLATQMRVHESALMATLEGLRSSRERNLINALARSLVVFMAGSVIFAILCVAGFAEVRRRLNRPLHRIEEGVQALTRGELGTRIDIRRQDELGELASYINAMADERQRYEEDLRHSEERFRQLAENITEVFWLTDRDKSDMVYISPSYETIWGRSRDALYADANEWMDAVHPEDRARVMNAAKEQGKGLTYDELYRIVRPDGTFRWISDRAFPVRDDQGAIVRIAGLAEDVTDEVEASNALRERVKELHCLYQVVRLTTGNDEPLENVYQSVADLLPTSLVHSNDAVARLRIGDKTYSSGKWRQPAVSMSAPIAREGGTPGTIEVGYLSAHAEAPVDGEGPFLKEERSLLDGVASHIERMLHGRQMAESLLQSQRLESVGQLTGGVAHDFNNLLTVIIGNTELLQEKLDDDDLSEMAEMIANAAHRGAELTHRLLAFARRQPLEPKSLDLGELIASIDPLLRRTLGEHFDIKTVKADNLWLASADPAQLEGALLNLAINARDAMPGGGRLTIETGNVDLSTDYVAPYPDLEAGQYIMLAVSDTGSGIPAEDLARVFEPFYTTKEVGKGTGLGLSMVYGFAKQSRGHVNIYSEVGQGTTVKLYLPRARQDEMDIGIEQEMAAGGGAETILVVEDDDLVRRYVHKLLESLGYNVLTATNGNAALEVLESNPDVDLLFTDVVMPGGMSGRDLAEEVQRRKPGIHVLYTSGYTENAIVHHGRLDPSVILLSKPYRREDLAASVRKALGAGS